jgi:YVTN family beta-propeller protein
MAVYRRAAVAFCVAVFIAPTCAPLAADEAATYVPTGMRITPTAAAGSTFERLQTGLRADGNADAGDATALALSPDGKTLLALTSGYNLKFLTEDGTPIVHAPLDPKTGEAAVGAKPVNKAEWVFVYDVSAGKPKKLQQIAIPDTYDGLAWRADSRGFYVSGGIDDRIYSYVATRAPAAQPFAGAPAYTLGHNDDDDAPFPKYDGGLLKTSPAAKVEKRLPTGAVAAGIATSADGKLLAVANMENDSVSLVDTASHAVTDVSLLRTPGAAPQGEFPYGVAIVSRPDGAARTIFVSSLRDDEVLAISPTAPYPVSATEVCGAPNALALSPDGTRLYAVCGNADAVAILDAASGALVQTISLARPGDRFRGANANALAVAPDGKRLYVSLGGENAVAVVDLAQGRVVGRIPTGWYPTGVAIAKDGSYLYVCNEKSDPGPNPDNGYGTPGGKAENPTHQNQYGWALEKAGLLSLPIPSDAELARLSAIVDTNVGYDNRAKGSELAYLHGKITHVIYITDENRTYDQVLGDLKGANGDPVLNTFPEAVSPNHHALARDFVTFDNFYDPGESSGVGWNWSEQGHTNDYVERAQAVDYGNSGGRGLTYDYQGVVRNLNLALPQTGGSTIFDERLTGVLDPTGASSMLPGPRDPAASDGDGDLSPQATGGYLWDDALRHGLAVRNYGEHVDLDHYDLDANPFIPVSRTPFASHVLQAAPAKSDLAGRTDPYYRGFDQNVPDQFRIDEWQREFAGYVRDRDLPGLEVMTVPHDHFGDFKTALDGLGTPELQFADNDFALGRIVAAVSHSPYWKNTVIFIDEDDSQSGPDHVNSHRSTAFVISPYVKRGLIDHTRYTTDNLLRSIESILGLDPLSINDANAVPMATAFAAQPNLRPYDPIVPGVLCKPPVSADLLARACTSSLKKTVARAPLHDGAWWAAMTAGMDFSHPDALDAERFNAILYYGITGTPLPSSS